MKGGARKVIFEFLSIVIAVVLAMGLTEWRQDILNHRQAEESYKNIIEEIRSNYNNLEPDSVQTARTIKLIGQWLETQPAERDTLAELDYTLKLLSKSAWEVAKMNQSLTFLDNKRVLQASLVYEFHELYVASGRDVFEILREMQKTDSNSEVFEGEMKALRMSLGLTYNAMVGYMQMARRVLKPATPSSASTSE